MYVLYFTIFTGIESIPPGMSDLGVMIMIGFWYAMQREGKEKSKEESSLTCMKVHCMVTWCQV